MVISSQWKYPLELYKTKLSYGCNKKDKVTTNMIGIKCMHDKVWLVKEFYSQLASPVHYKKQIKVFVPMDTVHLLGLNNFTKLICTNNLYLQSVITVPIKDFQHNTLDISFLLDSSTNIDQTTLLDVISNQSWCLSVDKLSTPNKVLVLTSKAQIETAQQWINQTLPNIYSQHIADKFDVTTIKRPTPQWLNKLLLTAASTAYADKLKHRTTSNHTMATQQNSSLDHPKLKNPHMLAQLLMTKTSQHWTQILPIQQMHPWQPPLQQQ